MINKQEFEKEKKYLGEVDNAIDFALNILNEGIEKSQENISEMSRFLADNFYDMDDEEHAVQKNLYEKIQLDLIDLKKQKFVLEKQKQIPYFARLDFTSFDDNVNQSYYIGIANLMKKERFYPLVIDWRTPFASMYYDNKTGKASYTAPMGEIQGEITLKRQIKINNDQIIYAFDSDLTIDDEILKQTLGKNTQNKMQTIVATIQQEQNKIIRTDCNKNLLIQGIAGSGKTSIALHRVAYLIYKYKISSKDILIISPSNIFNDYIKDVLPELGEENTPKTTFEEIAKKELSGFIHLLPKSEMLENFMKGNKTRIEESEYKASFEFFESLKQFLEQTITKSFVPQDIKFGKTTISAQTIEKLFNERYQNKVPSTRIQWIADYILEEINIEKQNRKIVYERVKKVLLNMFINHDILEIYDAFLCAIGMTYNKIGFEDIPALLYIKYYILGIETEKNFKHIVIDEMQNYSPIALEIINQIYPCEKTILGDIYQAVEKRLSQEYLAELAKMLDAKLVKLAKSYRSTLQIAEYSQKLISLQKAENFKRNGNPVKIIKKDPSFSVTLINKIKELSEKYQTIAIITPSIKDSEILFKMLYGKVDIGLIGEGVGSFGGKINVVPSIFIGGLEFDAVVFVKNSTKINPDYFENNIKYLSATRALHELVIFEN